MMASLCRAGCHCRALLSPLQCSNIPTCMAPLTMAQLPLHLHIAGNTPWRYCQCLTSTALVAALLATKALRNISCETPTLCLLQGLSLSPTSQQPGATHVHIASDHPEDTAAASKNMMELHELWDEWRSFSERKLKGDQV